ncbi:MAG: three-Cys-motif partner protein TcmP [Terracidiphilus sp.]|jgi:three-Cys-motif partner protein
MKNETLLGEPDEFVMPERGSYTEDKYALIRLYCDLFSSGMRYKWRGKRTYVDLYAGSGLCRIEGSDRILLGSPLIALSVESRFDRYIFCENDPTCMTALKGRVKRMHPEQDVSWIDRDCNEQIKQICDLIPEDNLVLCFVDPDDCGLRHETLKRLSESARGVDFLCLLAFQMDAKRAITHYLNPDNRKIDEMLGNLDWRDRWTQEQLKGTDLAKFLALEFARSMEGMGYRHTELADMRVIKRKHLPLYYLALFSKHPTAFKYWDQVLKYATPQRGLFN